jgi:AAA+ superfamily predicted ATPase
MSSSFTARLRALMRAPYALIHLDTHEEQRAVDLVHQLATHEQRPVWEWSSTQGFGPESGLLRGDLREALEQILQSDQPGVFIFKDAASELQDIVLRRRVKELEHACAQQHKTLIFVGPETLEHVDLSKHITRLVMPLPGRAILQHTARGVFDQSFDEELVEAVVNGALGLTQREAWRAFYRVMQQYQDSRALNKPFDVETSILEEKQRIIGNNDALEFQPLKETLSDVGGLGDLKKWLGERERAFSEEARRFGLPAPKGLLLVGVQGCGKSLTAKAVGRYWGLPLLRLDLGRVFEGRRSPEETLREALQTSEALAPCVLWLDEIEKGFAQDSDGRSMRVLGGLLTWLQEKSAPVFMVATANQVEALPPELLRKGRFDEIFFVDLPDIHDRKEILKIHLQRRKRAMSDEVVEQLATRCDHFSGAELEQVVISGLYMAFAAGRELTPDDLVEAARELVPLYQTYEEQIKALRDWASNRARPAAAKRRVLDMFRQT